MRDGFPGIAPDDSQVSNFENRRVIACGLVPIDVNRSR
jgi:hypothetical protein